MQAVALPFDVVLNVYRLEYHEHHANLLSLSHVCRLWRQALREFPDFWATIELHLGKSSPDRKAAYWVKRAGQRPLAIRIRSDGAHPLEPVRRQEVAIVQLGVVLRGCMDRWDAFVMSATSHEIELLLPLCTGGAPRLRAFDLRCRSNPRRDPQRLLVPFLPCVEPRPDSFRLSVSIHDFIPRFTMFGAGITRLSVGLSVEPEDTSFNLNDLFAIFQSCPNLIIFKISAPGSEDMGPPSFNEPIILSRLTSLSISWIRNIEDVLSLLQLPSLESIVLNEVDWSDGARVALWNIFGSSHSLSSVSVGEDDEFCYHSDPAPFQGTPLTLHNATTLHMWGTSLFMQPLLDLLTLPHLEKLELGGAPLSTTHRLISLSTDLREISLYDDSNPVELDPPLAPIVLPSLESLKVTGFPALVHCIHAPRLSRLILEINPDFESSADFGAVLRGVVERSGSALTTLHLKRLEVEDADIRWCLERLTHLEDLCISYCVISNSTLSALASPPVPEQTTGWLLPRLRRFEFDNNSGITPSGAIEFLASRTVNPVPNITGQFGFVKLRLSSEDTAAIMSYGNFLTMSHTIASP